MSTKRGVLQVVALAVVMKEYQLEQADTKSDQNLDNIIENLRMVKTLHWEEGI